MMAHTRKLASNLQMTLSRNFRTTYYKTLGVPVVQHIVNLDASFAALLSESVVNLPQLLNLALELGVAPQYRARIWLLLVEVLPPYSRLWSFVLTERRAMFEDLVDAAHYLQPFKLSRRLKLLKDEETAKANNKLPLYSQHDLERLVHLHQTYQQDIATCDAPMLRKSVDRNFLLSVARVVFEVLPHDAERFWCFTGLLDLFNGRLELVDPMVTPDKLYNASLTEFESVFLRTMDVKRRRLITDRLSNLHLLKSCHDDCIKQG
ncbi:putative Rab-GTPase-TBC domain superfamily, TBC1 domain family member 7 [Plasmopara halstedii]